MIPVSFRSTHFNDRRDLSVDVVVGEMKACSEGALVQQWVLVKLYLSTGISLVQTHSTVCKVDDFPQDQLWSCRENIILYIIICQL